MWRRELRLPERFSKRLRQDSPEVIFLWALSLIQDFSGQEQGSLRRASARTRASIELNQKSLRVQKFQYSREVVFRYFTGLKCIYGEPAVAAFGNATSLRTSSPDVSEAIIVVLVPCFVVTDRCVRIVRSIQMLVRHSGTWGGRHNRHRCCEGRSGRVCYREGPGSEQFPFEAVKVVDRMASQIGLSQAITTRKRIDELSTSLWSSWTIKRSIRYLGNSWFNEVCLWIQRIQFWSL